ncbi:hypothetical protein K438DRAFT_1635387 [Mycena galopus ATCC 62051]|nr:hypothetical protein K438DRAFT_1635387 [Mycena galopus ATCC 62051]
MNFWKNQCPHSVRLPFTAKILLIPCRIFCTPCTHVINIIFIFVIRLTYRSEAEVILVYCERCCLQKAERNVDWPLPQTSPQIKLGKARGLDPRRTQAFNRPIISRYFAKLQRIIDEHDIPVKNIYNMKRRVFNGAAGRKGITTNIWFMA